MSFLAVSLWGASMMAAIFYTQEARHPQIGPLAAYLTFATIFTATALVSFGVLSFLADAAEASEALSHPLAAAGFQLGVFLPAFFLARWQIRKPPRGSGFAGRARNGPRF